MKQLKSVDEIINSFDGCGLTNFCDSHSKGKQALYTLLESKAVDAHVGGIHEEDVEKVVPLSKLKQLFNIKDTEEKL